MHKELFFRPEIKNKTKNYSLNSNLNTISFPLINSGNNKRKTQKISGANSTNKNPYLSIDIGINNYNTKKNNFNLPKI